MKKLITAIAILIIVLACNDPKDPPDDEVIERLRAEKKRVADSTQKTELAFKQ